MNMVALLAHNGHVRVAVAIEVTQGNMHRACVRHHPLPGELWPTAILTMRSRSHREQQTQTEQPFTERFMVPGAEMSFKNPLYHHEHRYGTR